MMARIDRILKYDLCVGCGLCSAIDKRCSMQINNRGFYEPVGFADKYYPIISRLCPGIYLNNRKPTNTTVWGSIKGVFNVWASDETIRYKSASGGAITALAIYLLESGQVDGILHVGACNNDFLRNQLFVSRTREEIIQRTGSRYAPAMMFDRIFDILDNEKGRFAFIGKPCDIAAMRAIVSYFSLYKDRITHYLAIFCAGMPSTMATQKVISTFSVDSRPNCVNYRGNGWPGFFTVDFEDGSQRQMGYNESWGKILGRDLGFRCKICPDGIGLQGDISSGDSWDTLNGYPEFTEAPGKNFCLIRTNTGKLLFDEASATGYIVCEGLDVSIVGSKQPYQYERRHYVGWRIAIVQLLTGGLLHFRGMNIYKISLRANYIKAACEALGTVKRILKIKQEWDVQIK